MKRNILYVILLSLLFASSCSIKTVPPRAVSTIAVTNFADLKLDRKDYEILNNITATVVVNCKWSHDEFTITDNSTFSLNYEYNKKVGRYVLDKYSGVIRMGYLSNDYGEISSVIYPEEAVRRLAIYRAIELAKEQGADGLIEPLISTNVDNGVYATTVTAKIIKLKTNR